MNGKAELVEKVEVQIESMRTALANRCYVLAQHMTRIAKKLESDDVPYDNLCINDLGEIQSQRTIIDAECGRLMSKIEVLDLIKLTE